MKNQNTFPERICRTAFCPYCAKNGRPKKGNSFLTFGGSKENYLMRVCERIIAPSHFGFTPHLFTYQTTIDTEANSLVVFKKVCLMNGCGINFDRNEKNELTFSFTTKLEMVPYTTLSHRTAMGLVGSFSDSGYELDWGYSNTHRYAVVSKEYNYLELRRLYRDKEKQLQAFAIR